MFAIIEYFDGTLKKKFSQVFLYRKCWKNKIIKKLQNRMYRLSFVRTIKCNRFC